MFDKIRKWFTPKETPVARNASHAKSLADSYRLTAHIREATERLRAIKVQIHREARKGKYHLTVEGELSDALSEGLMVEGYILEPVLVPSEAVYEFSTKQPRLDVWTKITWGKDA